MMKKLVSVLLCAFLLALAITGCGSNPQGNATPATPGEPAAAQGDSQAPVASDPKTTVRFMVGGSAEELECYVRAVDGFNAQSDDVFVEMIGLPGEGYAEKVITQLQSNTAPDCFYSEESTFGEQNKSDILLDLSTFLDEGKYGLTRDDVPDQLVAFNTYNGKLTGIPVDSNPMVIYYNSDLFNELGIKNPQQYVDEGTWTFAALQEISEQFRDKGSIGFVFEKWWGPMYSFLLSRGDSVFNADNTSSNFDSPRMLAGMKFLEDNLRSGAFVYVNDSSSLASGESPDTLFMSGRTGLIYAGRWFVPDFQDIGFNWDVVPFPGYQDQNDSFPPMPATPLVINKATADPEAVWKFVSFYCGKEGQNLRMAGVGNAVPTVPGLESIVLTGTPEHAQYFLDAVQISFTYPLAESLHPGLSDLLADELEMMLVGEQDAATTLANFKTIADAELQK